jgi:uncharacterized protein YdcH (DUF465 family)
LKAKLEYRFDISKYLKANNEEENDLINKYYSSGDKINLNETNKEKIENKDLRRVLLSGSFDQTEAKKYYFY